MSEPKRAQELYNYMLKKGYPEDFSYHISQMVGTEFTAGKMISYLSHYDVLPLEMVADEAFAILTLRNSIRQKHILENNQAAINEMWLRGFDDDDSDEGCNQDYSHG